MFNSSSGLTPSDVLAMSNNDGWGSNGGWLWFLIVIFALFGGWGNGFGNGGGVQDNYILTSDFSQLSRQISDSTAMTERKLDGITNGICSLGYDQLAQMNGINQNISNSAFATQTEINGLSRQLSDCCCQNRYDALVNSNNVQNAINNGFCQTNFNAQTNTRDIVDSQNAGTQAILAKLSAMESNAKDERIAQLTAMNSDLKFQASQVAQNSFIQNLVKPPIQPCYVTQNPYCSCGNAYYYGTTIS